AAGRSRAAGGAASGDGRSAGLRRGSAPYRGRTQEPQGLRVSAAPPIEGGACSALPLGLEREAHADGAEAAVDVKDLPGDAGGEIRAKEGGGVADVLERHVAPQGRYFGDPGEHLAKSGDPGGGERLDRSC